jgi:predicted AAA+ superfamily ATPase
MIDRPSYLKQIENAVGRSPISAILGPRQCGKTTLAKMFGEGRDTTYFDLESQPDLMRLQNPELALGSLKGVVILDEIQELPELFNVLRVLVDRPETKCRFLILGSASPDIVKNASETLASRIEFIELTGFDLTEIDLFFLRHGRRYGIEFKFSEAPKLTKSMHMAMETLKLDFAWIIYPGEKAFPVKDNITVCPLRDIESIAASRALSRVDK